MTTATAQSWTAPEVVQHHVDRAEGVGASHVHGVIVLTPAQLVAFAQECYKAQADLMGAE